MESAPAVEVILDVDVAAEDVDQLRLQYLGGFYPSGAVVAVQVKRGRVVVDTLIFNPGRPEDQARLRRLSKLREVQIRPRGEAGVVVIRQGEMARRELLSLLDKAAVHLRRCHRLDWGATKQRFTAGG